MRPGCTGRHRRLADLGEGRGVQRQDRPAAVIRHVDTVAVDHRRAVGVAIGQSGGLGLASTRVGRDQQRAADQPHRRSAQAARHLHRGAVDPRQPQTRRLAGAEAIEHAIGRIHRGRLTADDRHIQRLTGTGHLGRLGLSPLDGGDGAVGPGYVGGPVGADGLTGDRPGDPDWPARRQRLRVDRRDGSGLPVDHVRRRTRRQYGGALGTGLGGHGDRVDPIDLVGDRVGREDLPVRLLDHLHRIGAGAGEGHRVVGDDGVETAGRPVDVDDGVALAEPCAVAAGQGPGGRISRGERRGQDAAHHQRGGATSRHVGHPPPPAYEPDDADYPSHPDMLRHPFGRVAGKPSPWVLSP